jgi:hypothetical protein
MSMASEMISLLNPISLRSNPVRTATDSVPGAPVESSAGMLP